MTRILSVLAILGFSMNAAAGSVSFDEIAALPALNDVEVVVNMPSPMLAVQPTGFVNFTFPSCAKQPFETQVLEANTDLMVVKITLPEDAVDCRASARDHSYSMQISSDMNPNARVIVLNPRRPVQK